MSFSQIKCSIITCLWKFEISGTVPISQIPTFVSESDSEISKFQRTYGEESMIIKNIEVSRSDVGRGFKYVTNIKPFVVNNTGKHEFQV